MRVYKRPVFVEYPPYYYKRGYWGILIYKITGPVLVIVPVRGQNIPYLFAADILYKNGRQD